MRVQANVRMTYSGANRSSAILSTVHKANIEQKFKWSGSICDGERLRTECVGDACFSFQLIFNQVVAVQRVW